MFLIKNADFVAVDKPAGISVHNVEDSENLLQRVEREIGPVFPVHRLDKETSGVQVLARNEKSAAELAREFQGRLVNKIYVGVLRGCLAEESGVWNLPLSDKSEGRRQPQGAPRDRVPCETRFRRLGQSKFFTVCEFDLITGRQHQIRKHSALAKHALVGDPRYGDLKYNQMIFERYSISRMMLHCHSLEIAGIKIVSPVPLEFHLLCEF